MTALSINMTGVRMKTTSVVRRKFVCLVCHSGLDPESAVHCESGLQSYKACLKLQQEGFENVKNIDGGMLCWWYDVEAPSAEEKG